jgi:hypothetical protein
VKEGYFCSMQISANNLITLLKYKRSGIPVEPAVLLVALFHMPIFRNPQGVSILKGQCHKIVRLRLISSNNFSWSQ